MLAVSFGSAAFCRWDDMIRPEPSGRRFDLQRVSGLVYRFRRISFAVASLAGLVIVMTLISSIPCGAVDGGQDRYPAIRAGLMVTLLGLDSIPWIVGRVAKRRGLRWGPWVAVAVAVLFIGSWAALTAQPRPCGFFSF